MNPINQVIVSIVKILPKSIVHIFAKRYIAGIKIEDAIRVVKELNAKGIVATMDVLGEAVTTKEECIESKKECLEVLDAIENNNLDANLSLKPTQLGLAIDEKLCLEQLEEILERAKSYNNFVRIDMEDSPFTDATIKLFNNVREKYNNVGIVVQAYLKRTFDDVKKLNKNGTNYRLCKGIYVEAAEIAYKDFHKVRENYLDILKQMIEDGNYVGIATHDDYLIKNAYKIIKEKNLAKDKYEFQMLYGVKENLRNKINTDGHKIRIYVPFGIHWYKYSMRRLQENPKMAWHITKSILRLD